MTLKELKAKIASLCEDNWRANAKALLISELGARLTPEEKSALTQASGLKLQPFVLLEMKDELQIVRWPSHPTFYGLFPLNASLTADLEQYFQFTSSSSLPWFNARFWAAFAVPPPPSTCRYLNLQEFWFHDLPQQTPAPPGFAEIPSHLIPPADAPDRSKRILESIKLWCSENNFELDKFLRGPQQESKLQMRDAEHAKQSALHSFVGLLSNSELSRISMPLDIVAKLLRHIP